MRLGGDARRILYAYNTTIMLHTVGEGIQGKGDICRGDIDSSRER